MTLDNELSQIETAVSECEKGIQDGTLNADAIVSQIHNIAGQEAQNAKCGEAIALLVGKLDQLKLVRLKELKNQHPNDPRLNALGRRAVNSYLAVSGVMASLSEMLTAPEMRPTVQAQNREAREGFERIFGTFFQ